MPEKTPNGFVLIELVMTLIVLGFIGAFVGLFLYTGINGFLASKRNSEAALKAQFALDRISAELRQVQSLPEAPVADTAITYTSKDLPGTRKIRYDSGARTIYFSQDGTENPLLDQVTSFNLSLTYADMDQLDSDEEIQAILIGFAIADVPKTFSMQIYPRTLINKP
jgi:hypothetical protein